MGGSLVFGDLTKLRSQDSALASFSLSLEVALRLTGKRLPALGSAPPSTTPTTRSTGSLTAAQKKTISEKRQAAVRRKLEKQRLASGDDDEEDPVGFGDRIDYRFS